MSGKREVVIIGSQSLHAGAAKLPAEVLVSVEVDLLMEVAVQGPLAAGCGQPGSPPSVSTLDAP